jgi:uncharacterized protein YjbJ (UPF0337 family)
MASAREQQAGGTWKQFKGRMKEAWGSLTDDDMDRYEGKRDQLEGYLEKKTGDTRENIRRRLDDLSRESKYSW